MNRQPITQEDGFGCGIACVAFLLGKNYRQTLTLFSRGKRRSSSTGFFSKELANILGEDYKCGFAKRNKQKIYKTGSIVFMKRGAKYRSGHYVTRWNGRWMDPWINFPICPPESGFRKRLPEKPVYVIYSK